MATKALSQATAIPRAAYVQATDPGAVGPSKLWVVAVGAQPYEVRVRDGSNAAWLTIGGGHLIASGGTPLPQRGTLAFTGGGILVTDDEANDRTLVTILGDLPGNTIYLGGEPLYFGGEPLILGE